MPYIVPQTLYSIKKKPFVVFVDKDSFPHIRGKLSLKVYLKIFLRPKHAVLMPITFKNTQQRFVSQLFKEHTNVCRII